LIRCPICLSSTVQVVSPGQFLCAGKVLRDEVPPGQGGNIGTAPIPLYGWCGHVFDEEAGRIAAVKAAEREEAARREQQAKNEAHALRVAEQKELEHRKVVLLAALKTAGNPGLEPRRVPGHYHLSLSARVLGKVGVVRPVDVEPAWPIDGRFTWRHSGSHGMDIFEALKTGYTPTGRFVPMEHGTEGDKNVEILYMRRRMWRSVDVGYHGRTPSVADVVHALERCLPGHKID